MRATPSTHRSSAAIRLAGIVVALIGMTGCATGRMEWPRAVIAADELAERLHDPAGPRIVLLDVREGAAYAQGHLAGAVQVDPKVWQDESSAADTGLDHQTRWHERIGALGVNGRQPVVLYDDGRMTEAARIWFILQHFGVPDAAVLDGGYPAMADLITAGQVAVSRVDPPARPVRFAPPDDRDTRIGMVDRQAVLQAIDSGRARILDVRTPDEYTGTDRKKNPRGGHLPQAINLPHKQLLDEHGRLKSPEDLAVLFTQAGLKRGETIITYCQSGGRASLAALAAERAGFGPVLNYYLSFGDWSADATCPLAKAGE